ncbi:MAG: glycosyltransferase [Pyrinomonadaceae bacterium]
MKRNVLQLIDSFHQGGTERQMVQLTRLLHESGEYRVHVACLSPEGPLRREVEDLHLGDIRAFPLKSFYDRNFLVQLGRFARLLRERSIDVVHTHGFYTNIFGMAGARLAGVPARIASRRETGGMRTGSQQRVERSAYRLAHAIIANAEAVREQLINEGVRAEKIDVVYNGLDLERLTPRRNVGRDETLAALNLPRAGARRIVTIVANLRHAVKDHPTFLRAARRVREAVPEAAFVIAGEGELMESLQALAAELNLTNDLFFIGRCERVPELLAVSEVCVLSSVAEGFSNSILEYMAAGRAVVATDVGGAREAISEGVTGYLVAAGDDRQMATRLITLLRDEQARRRMGERGRARVEEKFSCAAQLERTEKLYARRLLVSRTRRRAAPAHSVESLERERLKQNL